MSRWEPCRPHLLSARRAFAPHQLTPEAKLPERDEANPNEGDDHAWRHVPAGARRGGQLEALMRDHTHPLQGNEGNAEGQYRPRE